jgi:hypothetical protein
MSDHNNPFKNPKQPVIDATVNMLRTLCDSKFYTVEVSGAPATVEIFRKHISENFEVPKATPANVQRGMIHVRVKRPINQHAGDIFVGQFNPEILK